MSKKFKDSDIPAGFVTSRLVGELDAVIKGHVSWLKLSRAVSNLSKQPGYESLLKDIEEASK